MKLKLKVGITIRVDNTNEINVKDLKDIVRDYTKQNKFQINDISFKADYTSEMKEDDKNDDN